ncbi:MAG: UDP-2,3-diacylglucosamine diphosphatase [Thiofilum sp.]|uniref:UDP-2,3-diacylglucosamine diphosphatase n=1 Tax=Thiofilum sp. TaxID=2212733 RepID=UPI0025F3C926|nr:UDP-2,3-diacylglucosamine diphosphatase [Thiofilum sp.]MBK8454553.1 UDP-2,3-diacylglucosamine diphosphatase [Thiofilum sp.]
MSTWFISDLHLFPNRPHSMALLLQFLDYLARHRPQGLYILGDLFEYWVGDDVLAHPLGVGFMPVVEAFSRLSAQGVPIAFQHGNRDFLVGKAFAAQTGFILLPDQHLIDLYGIPTLLMHGDSLCTDDHAYQQLRTQLRNPQWQEQFLSLPLEQRIAQAQALRAESQAQMHTKAETILDVTPAAVKDVMQQYQLTQLIHGHTHRPAIHKFFIHEQYCKRIVLGDWYGTKGSFLKVDAQSVRLLADYYKGD